LDANGISTVLAELHGGPDFNQFGKNPGCGNFEVVERTPGIDKIDERIANLNGRGEILALGKIDENNSLEGGVVVLSNVADNVLDIQPSNTGATIAP